MGAATTGRFAPSPTGELHLGNLRTALISWLHARAAGGRWIVRMEDLDPVTSSAAYAAAQLVDLTALGLEWDADVMWQSDRFDAHREAIATLDSAGRVYECFCSRREIREAASAPHGPAAALPDGAYPGTCRQLTNATRERLRREGRRAALRLRADGETIVVDDLVAGSFSGAVDDVVLRRADGVPAYNVAVVVDDAAQGITDVVRGDDLLSSTPRQVLLQRLLGLPTPRYAHVPLVLAPDGQRLAKRHGAVTILDLARRGIGPHAVLARLAVSIGIDVDGETVAAAELIDAFSLSRLSRSPWHVAPDDL